MAPAHLFAGWYDGLLEKYRLKATDILQCYQPSEDLTNYLYDLKEGRLPNPGFEILEKLLTLYKTALANCDQAEVGWWEKSMQQYIDSLVSTDPATRTMRDKIYESHKEYLHRDWKFEVDAWKEGLYYDSGLATGRDISLFLVPFPDPPKEKDSLEEFIRMVPF